MRLINATVVATHHLVPGLASEGKKKGAQAGRSLGGWVGTEGQMSLGNILRSFPFSPGKDFWCYVYKEKP